MDETHPAVARVHHLRDLTRETYVLRFDRTIGSFAAGQYISIGVRGEIEMREYSIYSSPDDPFIEVLVREVEGGRVSRDLRQQPRGAELDVRGPSGEFTLQNKGRDSRPILFVATGTGISPFHSMVRGAMGLDYTLLHGIRQADERYDHDVFDPARVVTCLSKHDPATDGAADREWCSHAGRVTDYLRSNPVDRDACCYLCGNCDMIYEAFGILKGQGVPSEQLFAEVYY